MKNKNQKITLQVGDFVALLGRFNLEPRFEAGSTIREISEINIHPEWRYLDERWDADIAFLVLAKPVTFTKFIRPVCLTKDISIETQNNGVVVSPFTIFFVNIYINRFF
jgi:hypothetical protein